MERNSNVVDSSVCGHEAGKCPISRIGVRLPIELSAFVFDDESHRFHLWKRAATRRPISRMVTARVSRAAAGRQEQAAQCQRSMAVGH